MEIADIYKKIQDYLREPPLVIWGSEATIDFGLPSMSKLKDYSSDHRFMNDKILFKDASHLNDKGARLYTETIISELKK